VLQMLARRHSRVFQKVLLNFHRRNSRNRLRRTRGANLQRASRKCGAVHPWMRRSWKTNQSQS
ncbi:hypothetical protein FRC20_011567, partial [Serendipita sp. 405]